MKKGKSQKKEVTVWTLKKSRFSAISTAILTITIIQMTRKPGSMISASAKFMTLLLPSFFLNMTISAFSSHMRIRTGCFRCGKVSTAWSEEVGNTSQLQGHPVGEADNILAWFFLQCLGFDVHNDYRGKVVCLCLVYVLQVNESSHRDVVEVVRHLHATEVCRLDALLHFCDECFLVVVVGTCYLEVVVIHFLNSISVITQ